MSSLMNLLAGVALVCVPTLAHAQSSTSNGVAFEILDNSFLVEEAFNQEPGIFQNIFGMQFGEGLDWDIGFTQEWPIRSQTHQFSYSVPVTSLGGTTGVGDVLLNYRYQLWLERGGRPAFSPRITLILPSGSQEKGRGDGVVGWQVNLPFSKQAGDFYYHWNGGFTWLGEVRDPSAAPGVAAVGLFTPHLAASAIWRTTAMFNVMLETLAEFEEEVDEVGFTARSTSFTVSPGFRSGWNLSDKQVIVGLAAPITFSGDSTDVAAFVYFSYELPFRR